MSSAAWSTEIASLGDHHAELRGWCRLVALLRLLGEHPAGLREALGGLLVVGQAHVGLGEVGQQVGDERRVVDACELDGAAAHRHRWEVLGSRRTDARHVAEDQGDELLTIEWLGDRESTLVGDDRTIVVAHRVVDRGDGVEDVAGIDAVGPVDRSLVGLECPQAVIERFGEVGGLVVDDAEQVDRPGVDEIGTADLGDLARFHRQPERVLGIAARVGDARQPVQRFGFTGSVAFGPCDHASL
jgi:hypothetical protein